MSSNWQILYTNKYMSAKNIKQKQKQKNPHHQQ